jgi:hypothetical protein
MLSSTESGDAYQKGEPLHPAETPELQECTLSNEPIRELSKIPSEKDTNQDKAKETWSSSHLSA